MFFLYYRICNTDSGFWGTEFQISLFSSTDSGFWNTNHDLLIRSSMTMIKNWHVILDFLPWSRNFLSKNHDLYFKPRICTTEERYPKFCTPEPRICTIGSVVQEKNRFTDSGIHRYSGLHIADSLISLLGNNMCFSLQVLRFYRYSGL